MSTSILKWLNWLNTIIRKIIFFFRIDDGETLSGFEPESVDVFFNCSAIHHITSYNDYNVNRAYNTLARQAELLKNGGIVVCRDFR